MDKLIYVLLGAGIYHLYMKYKESKEVESLTPIVETTETTETTNGLSSAEGEQNLLLTDEQLKFFEEACEQYRSNPNCVCQFYWDKYRNKYRIMELCPNFEYFLDNRN